MHHVTETVVMPSEIEQLPDLQGFLKFASKAEWRVVKTGETHMKGITTI